MNFQNYLIDKLSSLISQYPFWSLKLMEEFYNAFCHLSCCFGTERIGLWPLCQVIHHDADVLMATFGGFQFAYQVHTEQFKWMCYLKKAAQNKYIHLILDTMFVSMVTFKESSSATVSQSLIPFHMLCWEYVKIM